MNPDYRYWIRMNREICQVPGCSRKADQFCHGPKIRPYGGGMGQKATDLSGLMQCWKCHYKETNEGFHEIWETRHRRDLVLLQTLADYAEYLDAGIDLIADVMDTALRIVKNMGARK